MFFCANRASPARANCAACQGEACEAAKTGCLTIKSESPTRPQARRAPMSDLLIRDRAVAAVAVEQRRDVIARLRAQHAADQNRVRAVIDLLLLLTEQIGLRTGEIRHTVGIAAPVAGGKAFLRARAAGKHPGNVD